MAMMYRVWSKGWTWIQLVICRAQQLLVWGKFLSTTGCMEFYGRSDLFLQRLIVIGCPGSIGRSWQHPRVQPRPSTRPGVRQQIVVLPRPNSRLLPPLAVSVMRIWVVRVVYVAESACDVVIERVWGSQGLVWHPVSPSHLLQDLLIVDIVWSVKAVFVMVVSDMGRQPFGGFGEAHLRHDCLSIAWICSCSESGVDFSNQAACTVRF